MTYGMNGWNKLNKRAETHARDCISRGEAIDQLHQAYNLLDAEQRLEDLTPARPERKKGRWSGSRCSVCGVSRYNFINILHTDSGYCGTWKYCPNCGAEMEAK